MAEGRSKKPKPKGPGKQGPEPVRILFQKTGGSYEPAKFVDTQSLPPEEQAEVARLLEASGLAVGDSRSKHDPNSRDDFDYELSITAGGKSWSILMDRKSLPQEARPLIDYLNQRAKYQAPGEADDSAPGRGTIR